MLSAFHDGGPLMYPIAGCSFALIVFVFERFIALAAAGSFRGRSSGGF